jgi:hypothetical protein
MTPKSRGQVASTKMSYVARTPDFGVRGSSFAKTTNPKGARLPQGGGVESREKPQASKAVVCATLSHPPGRWVRNVRPARRIQHDYSCRQESPRNLSRLWPPQCRGVKWRTVPGWNCALKEGRGTAQPTRVAMGFRWREAGKVLWRGGERRLAPPQRLQCRVEAGPGKCQFVHEISRWRRHTKRVPT